MKSEIMEWYNNIDWTAISAVATSVMAVATFITIQQNKKQLQEMRRQWNETNRARLTFAIIAYDGALLLKISNCGTATAYNIVVNFNANFLDNHFSSAITKTLKSLGCQPFCIEAGVSKYYHISPTYTNGTCTIGKEVFTGEQIKQWLDEHKSDKIEITGRYCDLFEIKEVFSIDEYINGGIIVWDQLTLAVERIKKGTIVQNNQYAPIQKSLHIIAEGISEIKGQYSNTLTEKHN